MNLPPSKSSVKPADTGTRTPYTVPKPARCIPGASRVPGRLMRRRPFRGRDPFWLVTRFAGKCHQCHAKIGKGAPAFYYPNTKTLLGRDCCAAADRASADFDAHAQDEAVMSGSAL